jgi:hypothetical protein
MEIVFSTRMTIRTAQHSAALHSAAVIGPCRSQGSNAAQRATDTNARQCATCSIRHEIRSQPIAAELHAAARAREKRVVDDVHAVPRVREILDQTARDDLVQLMEDVVEDKPAMARTTAEND